MRQVEFSNPVYQAQATGVAAIYPRELRFAIERPIPSSCPANLRAKIERRRVEMREGRSLTPLSTPTSTPAVVPPAAATTRSQMVDKLFRNPGILKSF
jgi:hypothetical protein